MQAHQLGDRQGATQQQHEEIREVKAADLQLVLTLPKSRCRVVRREAGHSSRDGCARCVCGWVSDGETRRQRRHEYQAHLDLVSKSPHRKCRMCGIVKLKDRMAIHSPGVCKECITRKCARWGAENPDRWKSQKRDSYLNKMYGISLNGFMALLESQHGMCAICAREIGDGGNELHVDHDHKSGRVRGILCGRCNRGIGQFNDDPALLKKALDYLL